MQTLIKTHALLHQATRERDPAGAIVATIEDYRIIRDLLERCIWRSRLHRSWLRRSKRWCVDLT